MSELRHDPLTRRWVVVSGERAQRPQDFEWSPSPPPPPDGCPFCPGQEERAGPEIYALREGGGRPNGPGWSLRVVPNRYPALAIEGQPDRRGLGVYDRMHGIGAHEVIIESPHHDVDLTEQPPEHVARIAAALKYRMLDLMRDLRFRYVLPFKNHGAAAGASLAHPHTQIIATPVTPRAVAVELETSRAHCQLKERCLYCDILTQELEDGRRIVCLNDDFVAFAPYASRFPFEVALAPRRHSHDFCLAPDALLSSFGSVLAEVLRRLKLLLRDVPYNYVLHSAPNTGALPHRADHWASLEYDWHWHVEILPRLTRIAGFEWGTGFHINPMAPEDAARFLREMELQ